MMTLSSSSSLNKIQGKEREEFQELKIYHSRSQIWFRFHLITCNKNSMIVAQITQGAEKQKQPAGPRVWHSVHSVQPDWLKPLFSVSDQNIRPLSERKIRPLCHCLTHNNHILCEGSIAQKKKAPVVSRLWSYMQLSRRSRMTFVQIWRTNLQCLSNLREKVGLNKNWAASWAAAATTKHLRAICIYLQLMFPTLRPLLTSRHKDTFLH